MIISYTCDASRARKFGPNEYKQLIKLFPLQPFVSKFQEIFKFFI
jgi:hypothetical protein